MFEIGRAVPLDYEAALFWYQKSADQGWPPAQASLGLMYSGGTGVARDPIEADKWFQLAALGASGNDQTRYDGLRETIETRMSVADIVEARQRARDWMREHARRKP